MVFVLDLCKEEEEKWVDLRSSLEVYLTLLADGLDMSRKEKEELKLILKIFYIWAT